MKGARRTAFQSLTLNALRIVADGVNSLVTPEMGVLVITHYQRLLNHITPDYVHIMINGKIVQSGTHGELLRQEGLYRRVWSIQSNLESELSEEEERDEHLRRTRVH